jgi:hypothetical protein
MDTKHTWPIPRNTALLTAKSTRQLWAPEEEGIRSMKVGFPIPEEAHRFGPPPARRFSPRPEPRPFPPAAGAAITCLHAPRRLLFSTEVRGHRSWTIETPENGTQDSTCPGAQGRTGQHSHAASRHCGSSTDLKGQRPCTHAPRGGRRRKPGGTN